MAGLLSRGVDGAYVTKGVYPPVSKFADATVGSTTLTAAQLLGGILYRTGPVGGYADTTPTAAAIVAAMDNPQIGDSFTFTHVNGVAQICTFTAGAGVTLAGTVNNAASKVRMYLCTVTNVETPAVLITGIGELVA